MTHQAPLSKGFPRQEYWSGLPFPSLGVLTNQGIKSVSPALAGRFFTTEPREKTTCVYMCVYIHIYIYICVCICVCIYTYTYMCVCICVCVYIYIHQSFCCTARTQYCKSTILRVFSCITKMTECPLPSTVKP